MAGSNDNDLSSDCDFDVTQKITRKRKKRSVISTIAKHNIHSKGTSNNYHLTFRVYYHTMKNTRMLSNHIKHAPQNHLKELQNLPLKH